MSEGEWESDSEKDRRDLQLSSHQRQWFGLITSHTFEVQPFHY
jgi:hypothetical protein